MKLPIKHEYFIQIKEGTKKIEWRDDHITFIDEETKEQLQMKVRGCFIAKTKSLPKEIQTLFTDDEVIGFLLK